MLIAECRWVLRNFGKALQEKQGIPQFYQRGKTLLRMQPAAGRKCLADRIVLHIRNLLQKLQQQLTDRVLQQLIELFGCPFGIGDLFGSMAGIRISITPV